MKSSIESYESVRKNFKEVSSLLTKKGYEVHWPDPVRGVRFSIKSPNGVIQKCQLKSRAFVEWDNYGGKGLNMVFPGNGKLGSRDWYLIPHDELFKIQKLRHGHAPKWDHPERGEYWFCPVSKELADILEEYLI